MGVSLLVDFMGKPADRDLMSIQECALGFDQRA